MFVIDILPILDEYKSIEIDVDELTGDEPAALEKVCDLTFR